LVGGFVIVLRAGWELTQSDGFFLRYDGGHATLSSPPVTHAVEGDANEWESGEEGEQLVGAKVEGH